MEQTQWRQIIKKYNKPINWKSHWQIINSFGLYILSWVLAYEAWDISPWLTLLVAAIAQVFYGRLFIIMHDCGHGSFYKSKKARDFWGYLTGIVWFTPYHLWSKAHAIHHKNSGNLDHRGIGDIWTMTVEEYDKASTWDKFLYRFYRFPAMTVFGGSLLVFFLQHRVTTKFASKKDTRSVWITNIAIVVMAVVISLSTSFTFYAFFQFFLLFFGGALGVLFFYVQHQYDEVYWRSGKEWDYASAALEGSSYLKLPKILQWASGNIGFHHIHHLSHTIPNYRLEQAMQENELFQNPTTITLGDIWHCLNLNLYDENQQKMIRFKELKLAQKLRAASLAAAAAAQVELKSTGNSLG